jgi:predicted outer membrane protein
MMKSVRNRGLWLGGLLCVVLLPTLVYVFGGAREQTSILGHLISITGLIAGGLLVYVSIVGTRFRARNTEFGVPLHKWLGGGLLGVLLLHILFIILVNPENMLLLTLWINGTAPGTAGTSAFICLLIAWGLGVLRQPSRLSAGRWRTAHTVFAWSSALFALTHVLWIDQLVNDPLWLIVFFCIVAVALGMWFTKPEGVNETVTGILPRFAKIAVAIGVVLGIIGAFALWTNPSVATIGYTQNELGPIGPSDRDMLFKIKQAGLWEMPVGEEASERATTQELRKIASQIADEHHELDHRVDEVARQLGILLPMETTPDQRRWMVEISNSEGMEYDQQAVFFLRQAHGKVLPLLASVRAGSRNELVRQFASEAMNYVSRHMAYLESTGLVDYSQMPEPSAPSPYQQPEEASFFDRYDERTLMVSGLLVALVIGLGVLLVYNLVKDNGKPKVGRNSPGVLTRRQPKHRRL